MQISGFSGMPGAGAAGFPSHIQNIINQGQFHSAEELRQQLAALSGVERGRMTDAEKQELLDACKMFEQYFIQIMLREMRRTVPDNGLIPRSQAENIFTDMLDEEIARSATVNGGIGLAQAMFRQMTLTDYSARVPHRSVFMGTRIEAQ